MGAAEITAQFERLEGNVSAALSAVASKGVTVPSGSTSDNLASLIASIIVLDLSVVTVTPETLAEGVTAYDASGNLITGTAQIVAEPSYTNVIPTAQAMGSTDPYNGCGYKDGYYLSSSSPFEGVDSATVLTGYIPYEVPSTGVPETIYVKGAEWQSISHCRWYGFDSAKSTIKGCWITGSGSGNAAITASFNVEQLGDDYFCLEPILDGITWAMTKLAANTTEIVYFRMSLVGKGADLIVTIGEPIE